MKYDFWNIIETYLPDYHHRDDVLYLDICSRYLHNEDLDDSDKKMIESDFSSREDLEKFVFDEETRLYKESVENIIYNENNGDKILVNILVEEIKMMGNTDGVCDLYHFPDYFNGALDREDGCTDILTAYVNDNKLSFLISNSGDTKRTFITLDEMNNMLKYLVATTIIDRL